MGRLRKGQRFKNAELVLPDEVNEPLFFVALALAAGVLFGDGYWVKFCQNIGLENAQASTQLAVGVGILIGVLLPSRLDYLRFGYGYYRLLYLFCFLLGIGLQMLRLSNHQQPFQSDDWQNEPLKGMAVVQSPATTYDSLCFQEIVVYQWQTDTTQATHAKPIPLRLIYLKQSVSSVPIIGQKLALSGLAHTYPIAPRFDDFQRRQYWLRKSGIVGYIRPDTLVLLESQITLKEMVLNSINSLREAAVRHMRQVFTEINHPEVAGLATALVLGTKNQLPAAILEDFATLGALHALAVSGAHLMIVASLLFWWPRWKNKRFRKAYPKTLLAFAFVVIVLYAGLTGWSASVVRAAIMATIGLVGMAINRKTSLTNSLGATVILLLLYDTNYLFDLGFQLSAAAVLGIGIIQPWLQGLYRPKSKPLAYLWSITVVAIAANLGTLPLSVYHFHQFPILFLVANLYIIWATELLLIMGLLLVVLSIVPYTALVSQGLAWLFYFVETAVLWANRTLASLPFAQYNQIYLPSWLILGIYGVILLLVIAIGKRSKTTLSAAVLLVSGLVSGYYISRELRPNTWTWSLSPRYPFRWQLALNERPVQSGFLYPADKPKTLIFPEKTLYFFPSYSALKTQSYRLPEASWVILPNNATYYFNAFSDSLTDTDTIICLRQAKRDQLSSTHLADYILTEEQGPFYLTWRAREQP